jgi:phage terminase large subunit-like protein
LNEKDRQKFLNTLTDEACQDINESGWWFWARPNQLAPEWDWYVWLILSGRGFGKTRTANELCIEWAKQGHSPIALVGETKADVRDTIIELGESAILNISPSWFYPEYEPSKRRITWPNGVVGIIYSGDEPDQLRGPQHAKAIVDELAKFKYPQDTWDNLMFGLRIGANPQAIVATTPRPIKIIKDLLKDKRTAITRGHTMDNVGNLAPQFLKYVLGRYEGTRLGRQELAGEVLEDNPDALWNRTLIDNHRVNDIPRNDEGVPDIARIVVGVDPPGGATECGIITAAKGTDGHAYITADYSTTGSPDKWAGQVIAAAEDADMIVGEANYGGDMVEHTIKLAADSRDITVRYKNVHATRGKQVRAEPIVALYEQGKVHHVCTYALMEDEMCQWIPGETKESPNRLDALVWALTELMLGSSWRPL